MARSKSPANRQKETVPNVVPNQVRSAEPVTSGVTLSEANRTESRKVLAVAKSDSRPHVVPINLEDEIRRRAYELAEQRGFSSGHETEDWLRAEREILQHYRQQSA
jgi:uncharacterized lipoprotein YajG